MAFHFPLAAVLHFRQSLEHQQELKLRAANQRVARVRRTIEHLDSRHQESVFLQSKRLTDGTTAAELRFELQCEAQLLRQRREAEQQLAVLEQARNQQRELFHQARRARETLATLRDKQLLLYRQRAARSEQRRLDDLFLMRLIARRKTVLPG
jgi:flagellar export protein FliJ